MLGNKLEEQLFGKYLTKLPKKLILNLYSMRFLFLLIFIVSCNVDNNLSQLDKRANEILSSLSLEDKVGQMTQINLTVIAKGPNKWSSSFPMEIDSKKAKKALKNA